MNSFRKTARQREAVKVLSSGAVHSLLDGGSSSGKSAILCHALVVRACAMRSKHVIWRKHFNEVKRSVGLETMPFILTALGLDRSVQLNKTDWIWTFPNDSQIWLAGLDEKDRVDKALGNRYSTVWFNEISEIVYDSVTTGLTRLAENSGLTLRAFYDCNPAMKKHWAYRLWFDHLDPIDNTPVDPADYARLQMNPAHNIDNLPAQALKVLEKLPKRKRERFLEGLWRDNIEGALWNSDLISAYRITHDKLPPLSRIVVGVDPAVTGHDKSDETGIVVVGLAQNGHAYVLLDSSLKGKPIKWARASVAAYKELKADRVVGEVNNGGDLVAMNLKSVDKYVPFTSVRASRGKMKRAEPVADLYEEGLVHHVGEFPELEDEQCSYTGPSDDSPNRMDALVWALTELMITGSVPTLV